MSNYFSTDGQSAELFSLYETKRKGATSLLTKNSTVYRSQNQSFRVDALESEIYPRPKVEPLSKTAKQSTDPLRSCLALRDRYVLILPIPVDPRDC